MKKLWLSDWQGTHSLHLKMLEINEKFFISDKLVPVVSVVTELELKTIFDIDFSWVWRS